MRVLWLCNIVIVPIAIKLGLPQNVGGGWLEGLADKLKNQQDIELLICAPDIIDRKERRVWGNVSYYGFHKDMTNAIKYDNIMESNFRDVISDFKPDIVHIFGTEYLHSLEMIKAFGKPDKTLLNIQGLVSICAEHYTSGLPGRIYNQSTLYDLLRGNLRKQRENLRTRGNYEVEAIRSVNNLVGRTEWDRACTCQINPGATYYLCNEILRDIFYQYAWNIQNIRRHSIFMRQSANPIKGLHFVLRALAQVKLRFPDVKLYVAGNMNLEKKTFKSKLKMTSYERYLCELIKEYKLAEHIVWLDQLNEQQMCERYLQSHVFASASTIENESNTLSEAKLLGVPCVASYVGGVTSRIQHGVDGFLYQHDAPYMLSYYICKIFSEDELAMSLSQNATEKAKVILDRSVNLSKMREIYDTVLNV